MVVVVLVEPQTLQTGDTGLNGRCRQSVVSEVLSDASTTGTKHGLGGDGHC